MNIPEDAKIIVPPKDFKIANFIASSYCIENILFNTIFNNRVTNLNMQLLFHQRKNV